MGYDMEYKNYEELKEKLLYKRIVDFNKDTLTLDDGTILSIVEAEQDCCAMAYGTFKDVKLDAVITNVSKPEIKNLSNEDTTINTAIVTIYHNQNPIAIADCYADAGNGGYYYSVCAFKINCDYYKIISA